LVIHVSDLHDFGTKPIYFSPTSNPDIPLSAQIQESDSMTQRNEICLSDFGTGAAFYKTIKISLGRPKRLDWFLTNEMKVEKPVNESLTQILNSHWSAQIE